MNKMEKIKNAPNGIPDTDELDAFLNYAKEAMDEKSIFTSVHQNMGWDKYSTTVMFIRDNVEEICGKLRQCTTLKDAFDTITGINNISLFLGWQVLYHLTESKDLSMADEDNWTYPGPGALKGIQFSFQSKKNLSGSIQKLTDICREAGEGGMSLNLSGSTVSSSSMRSVSSANRSGSTYNVISLT